MSGENRLRATLDDKQAGALDKAEQDRFDDRTHAERQLVERGLQDLGYLETPDTPHREFLWVVNRAGLGLGAVGLMAIGVGIFGPRIASVIGYGVTLTGFLLLLTASWLDTHTDRLRGGE